MAGSTNFPTSVDTFAKATPTFQDTDDTQGRVHSERHDDMEAAMEAVQTHALSATNAFVFTHPGDCEVITGLARCYNPRSSTITLKSIRASVGTAPTDASLICVLKKNTSTTIATQTITSGSYLTTRDTISSTTLAAGDYLTVDITQIGSTIVGGDLVVTVEYL